MRPLLFLFLLSVAAPSPEIRYFEHQRDIQLPQGAAGETCVLVRPEVFTHASHDLADLRLYRDGIEAPYVIQQALPERELAEAISLQNAGVRAGKTVFDAAMPQGLYSDLKLNVDESNFIATVTVSGGQTSGSSMTRIGSYTIFDLSREKVGRSTVLHLPSAGFPYLHFEVTGPLKPENFTGLTVVRLPESAPRYITVAETSQLHTTSRTTTAEFTVPAQMAVDRVLFDPPDMPLNFNREVTVSVSLRPANRADGEVASSPATAYGNLLRVRRVEEGHRLDEEQLAIEAPRPFGDLSTGWKVSIANGDDAPLKIKSVKLQMVERDLCFEAVAPSRYELYYGDSAIAAPRYDYGSWFTPHPGAAQATLGPENRNPKYQPRPDARPFTERHPSLLWAALIFAVTVLGAVALRTAARPNKQGNDVG